MIPDFIPIEVSPMSVFSAIGILIGLYGIKLLHKKWTDQDKRIDSVENNLNSMRIDTAETKVIVLGIQSNMSTLQNTNMEVIKTLIAR